MRLFSKYCSLYQSQDALTTIVDCWVVSQCVQNLSACEEKKKRSTMATFMKKKKKKTSESAQKDIQHLTRSFMQPHFHLDHQTRGSAACVDAADREALQPQLLRVIEIFATSAKNYPNVSLLPHGNHVITTVRQAAPNVHWRGRLAKAYPVL